MQLLVPVARRAAVELVARVPAIKKLKIELGNKGRWFARPDCTQNVCLGATVFVLLIWVEPDTRVNEIPERRVGEVEDVAAAHPEKRLKLQPRRVI